MLPYSIGMVRYVPFNSASSRARARPAHALLMPRIRGGYARTTYSRLVLHDAGDFHQIKKVRTF